MVVNLVPREEKKEKQYVIAYLDLLGSTERIKTDNDSLNLNLLYTIYNYAVQFSENEALAKSKYSKIETKIFSDNIIMAIPLDSNEPIRDICCLLEFTAIFQDFASITYQWLIRGGITIGSLFIDKMMVWGKGLIRAYELENHIAIYPRVVLDSSMVNEYGLDKSSHYTRRDADGQFFLNFLNFVQHNGQDDNDNFSQVARESYLAMLSRIKGSNGAYAERPYQKLQWYKNYLNMWYNERHPNERPMIIEELL